MVTKLSIDMRERVSSYVQKNYEKIVQDLQKLVQISSETGYEGEIQEHIRQRMIKLGLEVDTFVADESVKEHPEYTISDVETEIGFKGRPNVRGKWTAGEGADGKSLLMFTHVDTVPVGDPVHWTYPPTGGVIE